MKALVIGSGAREHALGERLRQERWRVACAPGNAGIARRFPCLPLRLDDPAAAVALARAEEPDLVVVGPEAPLVAGLADRLAAGGFAVFGPTAAAARIEGSKAFAKEVMAEAGVPTAAHATFDQPDAARAHARSLGGRVVVKADGLAGGKGVAVCANVEEAEAAIDAALVRGELGEAGRRLVLEERLEGRELSLMALCDGRSYVLLPPCQDYKRALDGDRGPNTGGMGAVSPPLVSPAPLGPLAEATIAPVVARLADLGTPFRGTLYAGLMLTAAGPRVLEYNCRFGDPETQVLVERIDGFLGEAMLAAARGSLAGSRLGARPGAAAGVVVCARGYPGAPRLGDPLLGIDAAEAVAPLRFAGVGGAPERPVTAGGRVVTVVGHGPDLPAAVALAYRAAALVSFPGARFRGDIGR